MAIKKLPSTGDTPRSTGVPASLVAGGGTDSAGYPWAGRTFDHHETAFVDDDGTAPHRLLEAVVRLRKAASEVATPSQGSAQFSALAAAHADALAELSRSRVLVPLLAEAGDIGLTPEGKPVEKTQELSIVTVAAPDGRRVMPVFSSVETMRAWNAEARPIPVPAPQAAVAAAGELTDLMIVDPGSPELELGVRRTQLEAVATAQRVRPPWVDAEVSAEFQAPLVDHPDVVRVELLPADPECRLLAPETEVLITLRPGLTQEQLSEILAFAGERWAASERIAERVDSLRVRFASASSG